MISNGLTNKETNEYDPIHLAFNYWHHPPSTLGSFENPYEDEFWKEYFEPIAKKVKEMKIEQFREE